MSNQPDHHRNTQESTDPTIPETGGMLQPREGSPTWKIPGHDSAFFLSIGQSIGDYELLTEIARGGMGVVFRARQMSLDRVVALKMILAGRFANEEEVARFRTEAGAAARLQHPNIVPVYDCEVQDGHHFFTMEFIDGTSLDRMLKDGPLGCKSAARYVRTLARAVGYAHKQGILHRDLKPSNILIDAQNEPRITDFGLAKRMGPEGSGQTRTGAVLGTPSYMSPEQAQGKTNELGPESDVYSLGAVLYELITGRPPFRAATPLDTVMQVIDHEPVPPRLLNPKIDHDLETICLKCLEKDPSLRYASADELGDDLQRYLDGDSIHARSFNMIDRLAHVLERDAQTADFSTWSSMVLAMAAGVFAEHFAVWVMVLAEAPRAYITVARGLLFVFLGGLFWRNRGSQLMPTRPAERELWTIWIGYFMTYFFVVVLIRTLTHLGVLESGPESPIRAYFTELLPYPFITLMSGLAFFIMGANYWGRCYAIGVTFFLAAPAMAFDMKHGPMIFGTIWGVTLVMLGLHLRRQGHPPDSPPAASVSTQAATVQYDDPSNHGVGR